MFCVKKFRNESVWICASGLQFFCFLNWSVVVCCWYCCYCCCVCRRSTFWILDPGYEILVLLTLLNNIESSRNIMLIGLPVLNSFVRRLFYETNFLTSSAPQGRTPSVMWTKINSKALFSFKAKPRNFLSFLRSWVNFLFNVNFLLALVPDFDPNT